MKVFGMYASVKVLAAPAWLDGFKKEYGDGTDHHVTLIQPRYIVEDRIVFLKERVDQCVRSASFGETAVNFSRIVLDVPSDTQGGTIMLASDGATALRALQKELTSKLSDFVDYVDPMNRIYEDRFVPHITIGCDLGRERFMRAKEDLPKSVEVSAAIKEVVLSVVANTSLNERTDPRNLTSYRL